jgi:hypothetical protein
MRPPSTATRAAIASLRRGSPRPSTRFPAALHLLGRDTVVEREAAVRAFQDADPLGQRDAVTASYLLVASTIDETMARLIQRKRGLVGAVIDRRRYDGDGLVEAVVRELRDPRPFRHLRPVA